MAIFHLVYFIGFHFSRLVWLGVFESCSLSDVCGFEIWSGFGKLKRMIFCWSCFGGWVRVLRLLIQVILVQQRTMFDPVSKNVKKIYCIFGSSNSYYEEVWSWLVSEDCFCLEGIGTSGWALIRFRDSVNNIEKESILYHYQLCWIKSENRVKQVFRH